MGVSLDTRRAHMVRQHGDLLAIYTWVNDERALVLLPFMRIRPGWWVVCESAAFKYDNDVYLKKAAMAACVQMGLEPSPNNWFRIAKVISEGLPDLIRMPGFQPPPATGPTYGHLTVRADGVEIAGEDLRDTPEGVTYA